MQTIVTDGVRLYYIEGMPWSTGSRVAQVSATGGETAWMATTLRQPVAIFGISPDRSELLVANLVILGADLTGWSCASAELWVQPLPALSAPHWELLRVRCKLDAGWNAHRLRRRTGDYDGQQGWKRAPSTGKGKVIVIRMASSSPLRIPHLTPFVSYACALLGCKKTNRPVFCGLRTLAGKTPGVDLPTYSLLRSGLIKSRLSPCSQCQSPLLALSHSLSLLNP
jgi:hypothetical protein